MSSNAASGPVRLAGDKVSCGLGPGDRVAGRFEIYRFVGAGAFAEVFKAYDAQNHRTVALKIPFAGIGQGGELWRLVNEVNAAQAVAHPNVMQAWEVGSFEIGESEPYHFIALQWIDGDTLRSVLDRSLGTLTDDEKIHFAHDLCAGIEAIHHPGILHRDIKPSNVMLTPDGRAIITDFGLATLAGAATNPRAGAQGFKAPELDSGGEPSEQSDIYSLGMVLLELFSGSKPSAPADGAGVVLPDTIRTDELRETLLRCIHEDPGCRPGSVGEVSRALPSRPRSEDGRARCVPVETLLIEPSSRISPTQRLWLVAVGVAALIGLVVASSMKPLVLADVLRGDPPVVLEYEARELLEELGFANDSVDRMHGYGASSEYGSPAHRVTFWYRQSPLPLAAGRSGSVFRRPTDPPLMFPGEARVVLDTEGRLLSLSGLPPAGSAGGSGELEPMWDLLLAQAGLDVDRLHVIDPDFFPEGFADRRWAWEADDPYRGGERIRVEAAAIGPIPVHFRLVETTGDRGRSLLDWPAGLAGGRDQVAVAHVAYWTLAGLVLLGGVYLCWRNIRLRHADLLGATRLAIVILAARLLVWLLGGRHTASPELLEILEAQLERGLSDGVVAWILYIAVEPFARRRWSWQVASWVRLLRGRVADPLVGRDLLVGTLFGVGLTLGALAYAVVPGWFGLPEPDGHGIAAMAGLFDDGAFARQCQAILGLRESLAMAIYGLLQALLLAFIGTVCVVFLRWLLGNAMWSRAIAVALFSIIIFPAAGHPLADAAVAVLITSLWLAVLVRFGFLAAVTAMVVSWWLNGHPATIDLDAWYATGAAVPVALVAAVLAWGYWASLGKESVRPRWVDNVLATAYGTKEAAPEAS
ncbi:MAG: serine/threonine protein kinase [Thermoanaerobaculia bacterium]|nr:serine/threonine protein kinase [Thermoanaerobaculia bacterium]